MGKVGARKGVSVNEQNRTHRKTGHQNRAEQGRRQITGFGTFERRKRAKRTGRNPQTGETITIAAAKYPAFVAGKSLKDRVQK